MPRHIVSVGNFKVGGDCLFVAAGPCSTESRAHTMEMMHVCKEAGADAFRSGAYKPRTRYGEFDGLKEKGLEYLAEAREKYGLPIVTEIMEAEHIPLFQKYGVDVYQVGTRNAQNFGLLHALGALRVPVLLKRGMANSVTEWLYASTHVTGPGNPHVILCERGVTPIGKEFRNLGDIAAIAYAKDHSEMPVTFDPSHATGRRDMVYQASLASVSAGADGLLIEVHDDPDFALTDGKQCILPKQLETLIRHASRLRQAYLDSKREYDLTARDATSGRLTVYIRKSDEELLLRETGMDTNEARLKIYDDPTGILQARVKEGCLGKFRQRHGRALGKITAFTSTSQKVVPIVSVTRKDGSNAIMTPYSAEAVKAAGKTTLDERTPGLERIELVRRYPTDIILDAFETFKDPLVLFRE